MRRLVLAAALLLAMSSSGPAAAILPSEQLRDPTLEARARTISATLRCVVCQNQSIDDSDAPLAHDLRVIVRERLTAGDSDAAAVQYLVDRYGHYVLLKPPVIPATLVLWLGPVVLLAGGGIVVARLAARKARGPDAGLTADEAAAAARLLEGRG